MPFVYEELLARIRAVLRRAAGPRRALLEVKGLTIHRGVPHRAGRGRGRVALGEGVRILVALAEDPERVFGKEELLRDVWGFRSLGRTRTWTRTQAVSAAS